MPIPPEMCDALKSLFIKACQERGYDPDGTFTRSQLNDVGCLLGRYLLRGELEEHTER